MYQVLGAARHSETLEELVVYQAMYGDYGLWVRPAKMFSEVVNINEPGETCYKAKRSYVQRFTFVKKHLNQAPQVATAGPSTVNGCFVPPLDDYMLGGGHGDSSE